MAADNSNSPFGNDPFSAVWSDWWAKMAASGMPQPQQPSAANDMAVQMRKAFFDAMSQHADQYLRSEAFLNSMKQSMDNALAWQQMVNQFLQKGVSAAQMPSRADSEHVVRLVRGMEDRLISKLESMEARVGRLEKAAGVEAPKRDSKARRARSGGEKK